MHIITPAAARAERNPPIDEVIRQNVVIPQFVAFLQRPDMPQLQFEAAWALTNVASGTSEHTKVVIDEGAVPILVQLLASPSDDVREQVGAAAAAAATPHCVTSLPPPSPVHDHSPSGPHPLPRHRCPYAYERRRCGRSATLPATPPLAVIWC